MLRWMNTLLTCGGAALLLIGCGTSPSVEGLSRDAQLPSLGDLATAVVLPHQELLSLQRYMEDALMDGRLDDAIDKYERIRDTFVLVFADGDPRAKVAARLQDLYAKALVAKKYRSDKILIHPKPSTPNRD